MFDQFEKMEKINLLEGEDDLGSDSCPCSCHPAPGNLVRGIVNSHHLGINYYVNFLGGLGSNKFQLK